MPARLLQSGGCLCWRIAILRQLSNCRVFQQALRCSRGFCSLCSSVEAGGEAASPAGRAQAAAAAAAAANDGDRLAGRACVGLKVG